MKNLYDLLRQKELAMKRLEKEIEAIRIVVSMLSEESEQGDTEAKAPSPIAAAAAGGSYSAVSQNAPAEMPKVTRNWP